MEPMPIAQPIQPTAPRQTEVCTVARRPREPVDGTVMATGGSPLRSGITPCQDRGHPGRVHSAVHRRAQPLSASTGGPSPSRV